MTYEEEVEHVINNCIISGRAILVTDTRSGELSCVSSATIKNGRLMLYLDHPTDEDYVEFNDI